MGRLQTFVSTPSPRRCAGFSSKTLTAATAGAIGRLEFARAGSGSPCLNIGQPEAAFAARFSLGRIRMVSYRVHCATSDRHHGEPESVWVTSSAPTSNAPSWLPLRMSIE
jgi:hypothetical protein